MENIEKLRNIKSSGLILTYDLSAIPQKMTMRGILEIIKSDGICLYNSYLGSKPEVHDLGGENANSEHLKNIKIIDVYEQPE